MEDFEVESRIREGHIPFRHGFQNEGNTSYASAILQCFFHMKQLVPKLLNGDIRNVYCTDIQQMNLIRCLAALLRAAFNNNQPGMKRRMKRFLKHIYNYYPSLMTSYHQPDATEFFILLHNHIQQSFTGDVLRNALRQVRLYYTLLEDCHFRSNDLHDFLNQIGLRMKKTTTCEKKHMSVVETANEILKVNVEGQEDLNDCIADYFKDVIYDGNYWCDSCHCHVKAIQKTSIIDYPDHLVISLRIFKHEGREAGMKIATNILPRLNNLNVRLFADKDEQPVEKNYELMSACYHEGRTLSSGRYTSVCQSYADLQWRYYDDSHVHFIMIDPINFMYHLGTPYVLFYKGTIAEEISIKISNTLSSFSICDSNQEHNCDENVKASLNDILALPEANTNKSQNT